MYHNIYYIRNCFGEFLLRFGIFKAQKLSTTINSQFANVKTETKVIQSEVPDSTKEQQKSKKKK